ncbi:MAG: hypothetical protein ACRERE_05400 [Candidatus Entotheonellia bacterium]
MLTRLSAERPLHEVGIKGASVRERPLGVNGCQHTTVPVLGRLTRRKPDTAERQKFGQLRREK